MTLRSVVVGAGLMGRWHIRAIRRAGGQLIACVDHDLARAEAMASQVRLARATRTLAEALADTAVDVVHVCTPLASHGQMVEEAVVAGAHAIVEKPLVPTAAETRQLLAMAEARGVRIIPVHQFPFQPGMARVLETLPALGQLRLVELVTCSAGADARPDAADQVALEILPHPLSILHRCFPDHVAEAAWHVDHPRVGEWHLQAVLGGTAVGIHVSMAGRPPCNELRLTGTSGRAHVDLFHGFAFREPASRGRGYKVARPLHLGVAGLAAAIGNLGRRAMRGEVAYPGLTELVAASYEAVRTGGPSPVTPAEALAVAESLDRIRARSGSPGS